MIPRIHRWRVPFEDAAPPRSTSHSPLPHHQADPACEPQFLVNLRILLARNIRCAYRRVVPLDMQNACVRQCGRRSQCTYRCVVLPDPLSTSCSCATCGLNAPTGAWCSLTFSQEVGQIALICLNAPTGAWCSLTIRGHSPTCATASSQCTYRCVVLPDMFFLRLKMSAMTVSMHLQVRGAP